MEVKIVRKEENPLLKRREVWFEIDHPGEPTPKKIDVAQILAAKLNAKLDLMVIKYYGTIYGTNRSRGLCLIYEDEKAMVMAEPLKKMNPKKRIGVKEEEKKEGEKGEAQTEQEVGEIQGGGEEGSEKQ